MRIVIFVHPDFSGSQSMPRYARMLADGMRKHQHDVEIWTAKKFFYRIPSPKILKKWLGYIDQFILFPIEVKMKMSKYSIQTLFVFADQALGPWMNLVANRPFVVHCHDFMAQRSALGEMAENPVKPFGRIYQKLIRKGYRRGKYFISVSKKTKDDLHRFLKTSPEISKVVYNGLNQNFHPGNVNEVREKLSEYLNFSLHDGYILHVGGNEFYKNRKGVIKIYNAWRDISNKTIPLIMIGPPPCEELVFLRDNSKYTNSIHFLINLSDEYLRLFYQGAFIFLFPSLDEGFGWPIAEALASGCPVVTTDKAPMTEVGGENCYYIPRMPSDDTLTESWAKYSAGILNDLAELKLEERKLLIANGIENARRFDAKNALNKIESIYRKVYQINQL